MNTSKGVLTACKPRREVLEGELQDAIFGADFGDLIERVAPKVYSDADTFFQNTEPTPDLQTICGTVFRALADKKESGQLLRLSTGFGGGKTHTLMALWHLAKNISDFKLGLELLPAAGRPQKVSVVAIDAQKAGIPVFATRGDTIIHSIQGELFSQLGGETALKSLGPADHHEAGPDEASISKVLGTGPLLILLDELVIYMASLSTTGQGNLLSFLSKLISAVIKRPQTVLVITDPGQQAAYAGNAAQLASIMNAALKLDDIFGRKMTDFDPVGKHTARVIARRLFERIDPAAAEQVSASYYHLYSRVRDEHPELLPAGAVSAEYAQRIKECYPFHPRLIDTARNQLGPLPEFQRSRGVLRLFARIIRDIWEQERPLELITAGDINWGSERIRADLLQRLQRVQFDAAVQADIEGNARQLDNNVPGGIHCRVASALLLESLPRTEHSGLDPAELTLAVLRTDEAGHEPSEALDRLVGACWHTYPMAGGRGWQFRFEPNIIKQIVQRAATVDPHEARERVLTTVQGYFAGPLFALSNWPERPKETLDRTELQLALCESIELAKEVCAFADTSDPMAPVPRRFRNAIVVVAPTPGLLDTALEKARSLIAAEQIERDSKNSDTFPLVREQLNRVKPRMTKDFIFQTYRAFDTVVRSDGVVGHLIEKYQVSEDEIMSKTQGQKCLRSFLEDKELIFTADATLDPDRFIRNVLTGTVPIPEQPEVYRLSDVHERFLSAPGLRLVPDNSVVRKTILKALDQGKVVLRVGDGSAYDRDGVVMGPEGMRQRMDSVAPSISLRSDEFITRAGTEAAKAWLTVSDIQPKPGTDTVPDTTLQPQYEPTTVIAANWADILRHAETRPLMQLTLDAGTPTVADTLLSVAHPLGAESLSLDVTVSGELKSGGTADFQVSGVKPNAPVKPLETARVLFAAMREGMTYGARLTLAFGVAGRSGMKALLATAEESACDEVKPTATFGKSGGRA